MNILFNKKWLTGLATATVLCAMGTMTSCSNEDAETRPGLWSANEMIETFPGDTVTISGQVSNKIGLDRLEINCADWGVNKVYLLKGKQTKSMEYNYQLVVPENATFDTELKITVTDTEGSEQKKTIPVTYLPDTQAPKDVSGIAWQVSVDYDTTTGKATYSLKMPVSEDRALKQAVLNIAATGYTETIQLSGREATITKDIVLTSIGTYDLSIELMDADGNTNTVWHQLVVMLAEDEDPVSDYPIMWVVNADETESNYLDGFYAPMVRKDAYQYEGKIYADKDGYQLYIVPNKTMTGDIFGASPYVASKLMNKKGYVVPVKIDTKGYYGLWIDTKNHIWKIWKLDTSTAYTGSASFAGCGFADWGKDSWGFMSEEMTRTGYRYTYTVKQNGDQSTHNYYAARVSDWMWIMRYWSDANGCGWWEDTSGAGGSTGTYESTYEGNVTVTFDTALMWATVKK